MINAKENYFFLNELIKDVLTKEDLFSFLEEINLVEGLLFKKINLTVSEKAKEFVSEKFIKKLQNLEQNQIITKNPETNQVFIESLKNFLENLDQVKIMISFKPREMFINKISTWLEKQFNKKIILDFIINQEVMAGAIIEYKGKQIDCSLLKEIKKLYSIQK